MIQMEKIFFMALDSLQIYQIFPNYGPWSVDYRPTSVKNSVENLTASKPKRGLSVLFLHTFLKSATVKE